jgi:hypothetical protein
MCTKILKKESSSRALSLVLLLLMMPLGFIGNTQSCGATEDEPLLREQGLERQRDVIIPINGDRGDVEERRDNYQLGAFQPVELDRNLPKINVSAELLKELDSSNAVEAMKMVKTALSLGDNLDIEYGEAAKNIDAIKKIYLEEQNQGIKCGDGETLGEVIIARGISGADVVQDYFLKNNEKIVALINAVQKHHELAEELRAIIIKERNENLSENKKNLAKIEKIHGKYKCLKTTRTILAICIPVAFIVAGAGAWALTWYLGGK